MLASIKSVFRPSAARHQAHEFYARIVEQARDPVFYTRYEVPDTLDGRFDLVLLHLFFVQQRLKQSEIKELQSLRRPVNEVFVADMDRNLREMGVGDTGVSHRIKRMGEAMLGRMTRYEEAQESPQAMAEALWHNVYREAEDRHSHAGRLAAYTEKAIAQLTAQTDELLLREGPHFFSPQ